LLPEVTPLSIVVLLTTEAVAFGRAPCVLPPPLRSILSIVARALESGLLSVVTIIVAPLPVAILPLSITTLLSLLTTDVL